MIPPRETKYSGVWFRSRLEARWAAFFDAVGWQWEYESIDLDGWCPDFILKLHRPIAVEVKPFYNLHGEHPDNDEDVRLMQAKMVASGWTSDLLLLGVGPTLIDDFPWDGSGCVLGLLGDFFWHEGKEVFSGWERAFFGHCYRGRDGGCDGPHKFGCRRFTIGGVAGSYHCRSCGYYDGNPVNFRSAINLWRGATGSIRLAVGSTPGSMEWKRKNG